MPPDPRIADFYHRYLRSLDWRMKREVKLRLAEHRCEAQMDGCTGQATQVHHLSYEHLGDEPLWELVAVCENCHEALHPDKVRDRGEGAEEPEVGGWHRVGPLVEDVFGDAVRRFRQGRKPSADDDF